MRSRISGLSFQVWRAAVATAFVGLMVLALGSGITMFALSEVQRFNRKIDGGKVDFGSGSHSFGSPSGDGLIMFLVGTNGFTVSARVEGNLYWDSLTSSGCARLTIRYRDFDQNNLHVDEVEKCGPGGDANSAANKVFFSRNFTDHRLWYVRVTVNEVLNGQVLTGVSKTVEFPPDRSNTFTINSGTADFGNAPGSGGTHSFGGPTSYAFVDWGRTSADPGVLNARVVGTLYWDALSAGCARIVIDFSDEAGDPLTTRTRDICGPGGNANNASNKKAINDSSDDYGLIIVKLRVGSLAGPSFVGVTSRSLFYTSSTGNFELDPQNSNASVHETVNLGLTWNVPEPLSWHDLESLQIRITDGTEVILWVLWNEDANTFRLFNERTGRFGKAFPVGSFSQLQTQYVSLDLSAASATAVNSALGTGPNSPSVLLNLPITFKPPAAGRNLRLDVSASNDLGDEDPFTKAATMNVVR